MAAKSSKTTVSLSSLDDKVRPARDIKVAIIHEALRNLQTGPTHP